MIDLQDTIGHKVKLVDNDGNGVVAVADLYESEYDSGDDVQLTPFSGLPQCR